ncbi:MAG: InlB B-repeat-containing protein, partial [Clostridia bacterium]|nr:InlB B-repeat-containing protein [Clostridia bacterium]
MRKKIGFGFLMFAWVLATTFGIGVAALPQFPTSTSTQGEEGVSVGADSVGVVNDAYVVQDEWLSSSIDLSSVSCSVIEMENVIVSHSNSLFTNIPTTVEEISMTNVIFLQESTFTMPTNATLTLDGVYGVGVSSLISSAAEVSNSANVSPDLINMYIKDIRFLVAKNDRNYFVDDSGAIINFTSSWDFQDKWAYELGAEDTAGAPTYVLPKPITSITGYNTADAVRVYYNDNVYGTETAETSVYLSLANWESATLDNQTNVFGTSGSARTGYTYKWSNSSNGVGSDTITLSKAGAIYAIWTPNSYLVTLDANNGSPSSQLMSVIFDSTEYELQYTDEIEAPTRNGYCFGGWASGQAGTSKVIDENGDYVANGTHVDYIYGTPPVAVWKYAGDVTLYAIWTPCTYSVTFHRNTSSSDTTTSTQTGFTYNTAKSLSSISSLGWTSSKTGYTAKGWALSSSATTVKYADQASVSTLSDDNDGSTTHGEIVDLYLVWKANSYTITLNGNNGTPTTQTISVTYGTTTVPTHTTPTRTGYSFAGWYTAASGGSMVLSSAKALQSSVSSWTNASKQWIRTSNGTLYAHWTANAYSITLNGNNGTPTTQTVSVTYGSTTMPTYTAPTRTGYTFTGWYSAATSGSLVVSNQNVLQKSVSSWTNSSGGWATTAGTLYAQWSVESYTVKLDDNGATTAGSATTTLTFGANTATYSAPVRTGYTFGGYTLTKNGTDYIVQAQKLYNNVSGWTSSTGTLTKDLGNRTSPATTGNITTSTTFYAKWVAQSYTIIYNGNASGDDSVDVPANASVTYGGTYGTAASATATRDGYDFGGWYFDSGCTAANLISTATVVPGANAQVDHTAKTITVYAKWNPITYTITLDPNDTTGVGSATLSHTTVSVEFDGGLSATPTATRHGYTFKGFYSAATSGVQVINADGALVANATGYTDANGKWIYAGARTLYAQWEVNTYNLGYWVNNKQVAAYEYDIEDKITIESASVEGYQLVHWVASPMGSDYNWTVDSTHAAGSILTGIYGHVDMNAVLSAETYNVILNYADADVSGSATVKVTYDSATITGTIPTPTRFGYNFAGWTVTKGGTDTVINTSGKYVYLSGYTTSGSSPVWQRDLSGTSLTLYSAWTAKTSGVTLTYQENGGTTVADKSKTFATTYTSTDLPDITKTGYTFNGWYADSAFSTKLTANSSVFDANGATWAEDGSMVGTIYAKFTPNTYTISFEENGGSAANSIKVNYDAVYSSLPTTTKTGYTFSGWYTAASGGTKVSNATTFNANTVGNIDHANLTGTLYAQWGANTIKVTYNANAGTGSSTPSVSPTTASKTYGVAYGTLATASRTGYTFNGWYTAASGGTKVSTTTVLTSSTIGNYSESGKNGTLYAHWTANTITVTYVANAGSDSVTITTGTTQNVVYDTAYGTLMTASRVGYNFLGWATSASATASNVTASTKLTNVTVGDYSDANKTGKLYAVWQAKTVTVKYLVGTPTGSTTPTINPTSETKTYGKAIGSFAATATREGYSFTGWRTGENGSGTLVLATTVLNSSLSTYDDSTATLNLYANWKKEIYTITLNVNGGELTSGTTPLYIYFDGMALYSTNTNDVLSNAATPVATREGYTFDGWYTVTLDGTEVVSYDQLVIKANGSAASSWTYTENKTLYAKWNANKYDIFAHKDTGVANATWSDKAGWSDAGSVTIGDVSYTTSLKKSIDFDTVYGTLPVAAANGYTFIGWTTVQHGKVYKSTETVDNSILVSSSTVLASTTVGANLYAVWKELSYTITFNTNSGSWVSGFAPTTGYVITDTTTLPVAANITRTGYTFMGWKPSADAGNWAAATTYAGGTSVQNKYGDVTLVAQWTANTVEVNLSLTGYGTATASADYNKVYITYNTKNIYEKRTGSAYPYAGSGSVIKPTATAIDVDNSAEAYTFLGWYNGSTQVINASGVLVSNWTLNAADGQTLVSKWQANKFAITLNYNQGNATETTASVTATYDSSTITGTVPTPTKTGYVFGGWATGKNGTVKVIDSKGAFIASVAGYTNASKAWTRAEASTTLYAVWTQGTYNVTYVANTTDSVTLPTPNPTSVTYDNTYGSVAEAEATRVGYTFGGWYKDASCTTKVTADTVVSTASNHNLYAKWTAERYAVSIGNLYDANGATASNATVYFEYDSDKIYAGKTGTATASLVFTRLGYDFQGLFTAASSGVQISISTGAFVANTTNGWVVGGAWVHDVSATITLFAQWNVHEYTITYSIDNTAHFEGVTGTEKYDITDANVSLYDSTQVIKTGYTLQWKVADSYNGNNATWLAMKTTPRSGSVAGPLYDDVTLEAVWTPVTTNITITLVIENGFGPSSHTATYDATVGKISQISGTPAAVGTDVAWRTGYKFEGFFTKEQGAGVKVFNADGSVVSNFAEKLVDENNGNVLYLAKNDSSEVIWKYAQSTLDLYAHWSKLSYTLNYAVGTGINSIKINGINYTTSGTTSVEYGSSVTVVAAPKAGYTLGKWTAGTSVNPTTQVGETVNSTDNTITYTFTMNAALFGLSEADGDVLSNTTNIYYVKSNATAHEVAYTLQYRLQIGDIDGSSYSDASTITGTKAVTDTTLKIEDLKALIPASQLYGREYKSFETNKSNSLKVAGDGSLVVTIYYNKVGYTITYQIDESIGEYTGRNYGEEDAYAHLVRIYDVESEGTLLGWNDVRRNGYMLSGWQSTATAAVGTWSSTQTYTTLAKGSYGTVTLKAVWTPETYTITYDTQGGTAIADETYTYGSAAKNLPTATGKTGYTFAGWTEALVYTADSWYQGMTDVFDLFEIYDTAGFTSKTYTVRKGVTYTKPESDIFMDISGIYFFDEDGTQVGVFSGKPEEAGEYINEEASYVIHNSWFNYEYELLYASDLMTVLPANSMGHRKFIANWTANKVEVTLDANKGTGTTTPTIYPLNTITNNKIYIEFDSKNIYASRDAETTIAPLATRDGYVFDGWYNGSTQVIDKNGVLVANWTEADSVTLSAKWKPNNYSIILAPNGGTISSATAGTNTTLSTVDGNKVLTATYDKAGTFTSVVKRAGYTFSGWSTSLSEVETTNSTLGSLITNVTPTGNASAGWTVTGTGVKNLAYSGSVTLYAIWEPLWVEITLDPNADAGSSTPNFETGIATDATGNGTIYVKYDALYSTAVYDKTSTVVKGLPTPTRDGYTFAGWFNGATQIKNTFNANSYTTYNDSTKQYEITLTAAWDVNKIDVIYHKNDGGADVTHKVQATYDEAFTFLNGDAIDGFDVTGYTFSHWTDASNGGTTYTGTIDAWTRTTTLNLYAQRNADEYTVTLNYNGGTYNSTSSSTVKTTFDSPTIVGTIHTPVRAGYTFLGWTVTKDGEDYIIGKDGAFDAFENYTAIATVAGSEAIVWKHDADLVVYARWRAESVGYTVYRFTQTLEAAVAGKSTFSPVKNGANYTAANYALNSSVGAEKTVGLTVSADEIAAYYTAISGFTTPTSYTTNLASNSTVVQGDGSLAIFLVYTRKSFTVTVTDTTTGGKGVGNITATGNAGRTLTDSNSGADVAAYTVYFGESVTVVGALNVGYNTITYTSSDVTLTGGTFTTPAKNVAISIGATAGKVNYIVNVYYQDIDASNELSYSTVEKKTVESGATVDTRFTLSSDNIATYSKSGFEYDEDAANVVGPLNINGNGTTEFTIYFKRSTYTLTIDANNGTYTGNTTVSGVYGSTYTLGNITRAGYDFSAWTLAGATGANFGSISGKVYTFGAGNGTVKATWAATGYTITYINNGTTSTQEYNTESTESLEVPTRVGYIFNGWKASNSEGTWVDGTIYKPTTSAPITLNGKYGDVTLTAQWEAEIYIVSLNENGGVSSTNSVQVTYDSSTITAITAPTRTGYIFDGWTLTPNGTDYIIKEGVLVAQTGYAVSVDGTVIWQKDLGDAASNPIAAMAELAFYAHWTAETYTITLEGNKATTAGSTSATVTYDSAVVSAITAPARTGYTFAG